MLSQFVGGALPDLTRIERNLPPILIRPYTNHDLDRCSEIYSLNEPGRFPEGQLKDFQKSLCYRESLYLVIELDGMVVGGGGISVGIFSGIISNGVLSYGLIDPRYHGKGIGTALLIFRLSLLNDEKWGWDISITSAGNGTELFYKSFGFKFVAHVRNSENITLDLYRLWLPRADIKLFRERIMDSQINIVGESEFEIPVNKCSQNIRC